jgi:transposase
VRRRAGQTQIRPARIAADKGSTGRTIRRYPRKRGIGVVIPRQRTEPRRGTRSNKALYRERNWIERLINRLKQNRAIATHYDK